MNPSSPLRGWTVAVFSILTLAACASSPPPKAAPAISEAPSGFVVLTTDFGVADGAVSEMKGVAYGVSSQIVVSDLTHAIPPFDIWQAAYRLEQTYRYWPKGSVFVTVVDPGVGSSRRSVVVRSRSGYYFVGPDNGHLTLALDQDGVDSVRVLDENLQRRRGSEESYTFHGRDLYAYVGARLAAHRLEFKDCGPETNTPLVRLNYQKADVDPKTHLVRGTIPVLDPNYGNVWSNIPKSMVDAQFHGLKTLHVRVTHHSRVVYTSQLPLVDTFASVPEGQGLLYFNSLMNLSLALNKSNFAQRYHIGSGPDWGLSVSAK